MGRFNMLCVHSCKPEQAVWEVRGMMWWWGDWPWDAGHWVGVGFMAIFWIAVIVGVIYLIRRSASRSGPYETHRPHEGQGSPQPPKSEALRILEERYARGDIDQEEFLKRKADLTS